ncbi:hypothetical protein TNCV_464531 [Trichonephila clavipes]|nr:hypothetical protein TNCV_464531 [Trichonephila clavipes]
MARASVAGLRHTSPETTSSPRTGRIQIPVLELNDVQNQIPVRRSERLKSKLMSVHLVNNVPNSYFGAKLKLNVNFFDVKTAYLYGDIEGAVYVLPPPGYEKLIGDDKAVVAKLFEFSRRKQIKKKATRSPIGHGQLNSMTGVCRVAGSSSARLPLKTTCFLRSGIFELPRHPPQKIRFEKGVDVENGVSSRPKLTGIVRGKAFLHVLRRRPIGCPDSTQTYPIMPDVMDMIESYH